MSNKLSKYFDLADQVALVSSELLRYRIKHRPELSSEQKTKLEDAEIKLDQATAHIRALGIAALADLNKAARDNVLLSTIAAKLVLRKIKKVEYTLQIAKAVLDLALAAIQQKPQAIVSAAKSLKDVVDDKML